MKSLFALLVLISLLSCKSGGTEAVALQGEALGTTYSIQFFSDNPIAFERSVDSIIEEVNQSMSTYRSNSDISRINRGDTSVRVDENFRKVFEASRKIYMESNGMFDPTVGVLVNAYGFGPQSLSRSPESTTIDSLRQLVGLNKVILTSDNKIVKERPEIFIDFNAIAKGFAIDLLAGELERKGVTNYLIELGGELRAKGQNLDKNSGWLVGIDDPEQDTDQRELKAILELNNRAMATSGNYRKFRLDTLSGQKYVHTINPKTGEAERSNLLSASVLAPSCMLADGYATAFMALGFEESRDLQKKLDDIEVYLLYSDDEGTMKVFASPGFQENLKE